MVIESLIQDAVYAVRGIRRSPLFGASVAGTIGLGLGILCSAFTIVNAYLLKPIDLPRARELYALSWDTAGTRYHEFRLADFDALRDANPVFAGVAAGDRAVVMDGEIPVTGLYVIAAAIVVAATIAAALVPSLRTSRIDPVTALRAE